MTGDYWSALVSVEFIDDQISKIFYIFKNNNLMI